MGTPAGLQFDRANFLSGGPNGPASEEVAEFRVTRRGERKPLYRFNSMLVSQLSTADVERSSYFLNANGKTSMFAFGRALNMMRLQCVLVDAVNRPEVVALLTGNGTGVSADGIAVKSQQAYEEFMAMYERELRASVARRKNNKVELFVRGQLYTGLVTSVSAGFAANADWLCVANIEFIVFSATLIDYPLSVLSVPLRAEAG